VKLYVLELVSI